MEQTEGLCSPGSATTSSFVNITVEPQSSQFVSFSAVHMATGSIPIKIRLYDMEEGRGIDAIEKPLNVLVSEKDIISVRKHDNRGLPVKIKYGNIYDAYKHGS